jgi:hypothetical protein
MTEESSAPEQSDVAVANGRPKHITAAVIIAFVLAVYEVAVGFVLFVRVDEAPGPVALWYVIGVLHFVFAGLLVWGGVAAFTGATNRILVLTAVAASIIMVITMVMEVAEGGTPSGLLFLVLYAVMLVLLTRAASKEFFLAKAG